MTEKIMKGLGLGLVVLMISGCTGPGGVGVRASSYATDRERADQKMEGGNFGYLQGTPVPEDRSHFKKTRKVYVLKITKDVEEAESAEGGEQAVTVPQPAAVKSQLPASKQKPLPAWAKPIDIPSFKDDPAVTQPAKKSTKKSTRKSTKGQSFVEYTVQKEDTLQKISKKFYDSYRQWPKIYETNKTVIEDPNRIKPGITLHIPVE